MVLSSSLPPADLIVRLLVWYDRTRRALPWRAPPGQLPDPYPVWISEIMLQQTTVTAVQPYYAAFLARWPTLADLAAAPLDDVLHAWQGLGYYARARNLHACAKEVALRRGGEWPRTVAELKALPGIGDYTAAAIGAIAFNQPVTPVDGNVVRVLARLYALQTPLPAARPEIARLARALSPNQRPGDFAQGLMDLGATVCRPQQPRCDACPWAGACAARAAGDPERFPLRSAAAPRPVRHGFAFWLEHPQRGVLLRRRPPRGLLGGMTEIPSTPWRERRWTLGEALKHAPVACAWQALPAAVAHTFTHFHLNLDVLVARIDSSPAVDGFWCAVDNLAAHALPSVMKKVARSALDGRPGVPPALRNRNSPANRTARPTPAGRAGTTIR